MSDSKNKTGVQLTIADLLNSGRIKDIGNYFSSDQIQALMNKLSRAHSSDDGS